MSFLKSIGVFPTNTKRNQLNNQQQAEKKQLETEWEKRYQANVKQPVKFPSQKERP